MWPSGHHHGGYPFPRLRHAMDQFTMVLGVVVSRYLLTGAIVSSHATTGGPQWKYLVAAVNTLTPNS
jgi:hypothetical protein